MLRLLDYGKPAPFSGIIGRPRHLAWPVNAFRVTLPRVLDDGDGLNAFERVVLKLLETVGLMKADALADETRMPLDLVKSVLLRLQDKDLIDEHHAIIERERKEERAPVFVTALLFRELATGKILPFLHWLDNTNSMQKEEGEGKDFRTIRLDDTHRKAMPAPRDVISTLRTMKKRSAVFGRDEKIPAVQQITIADEPELFHLDCPIAIQNSDGEFRIADPFGNGFSLILENAFEQLLEQEENLAKWLRDWKQLLRTPRTEKQDAKPKEPFETEANWQRYPKLVANLRPLQNSPFRSIAQIHAAIEWALFYACFHRPVESAIARLKLTAQDQHAVLLEQAAKAIGLEPPLIGFRPILEGKLREFQDGGAYQETVFAIALLQAQGDDLHPLYRVASAYPDLINRLFAINAKRNEKGHGKGGADAPQQALTYDQFMREVVHTLVPDIVFADMPATAPDKDEQGDALLDARASIQAEFGFKLFNRLGANLQDRLVHAERFFLSCHDGDDALAYVRDLYAAVQASFERALAGRLPPNTSDEQIKSLAESKAVEAGLSKGLPESLRTVKTSALRKTLQGGSQTLGACVLAWLVVTDADDLAAIQGSQPSLMGDMANLITRRGHGNEPLPLPKSDIAQLRKAAFTTIRTLMES